MIVKGSQLRLRDIILNHLEQNYPVIDIVPGVDRIHGATENQFRKSGDRAFKSRPELQSLNRKHELYHSRLHP
jgi:hypothetical protein